MSTNSQQNSESKYVQAVKSMCRIIIERTFSIFQQFDFFYQFTSNSREECKALKVLHDMSNSVIQQRKREILEGKINGQITENKYAFLDLLINALKDDKKLTDEEIREQIDTFMFAVCILLNYIICFYQKIEEYRESNKTKCNPFNP